MITSTFPLEIVFCKNLKGYMPILSWCHKNPLKEGQDDPIPFEIENVGNDLSDHIEGLDKNNSFAMGFHVWTGTLVYLTFPGEMGGEPTDYDCRWETEGVRPASYSDLVRHQLLEREIHAPAKDFTHAGLPDWDLHRSQPEV